MKKVLCMLMCAVLLLAMPFTAFAADTPYSGQGTSTLTYKSYSTCTVSIPETIEVSSMEMPIEIIVSNPNIETGYCVNVYVTNLSEHGYIPLCHDEFGEMVAIECMFTNLQKQATVYNDNPLLASIQGSSILSDVFYGEFAATVMSMDARAGSYTGTMQYEIKIEPISE